MERGSGMGMKYVYVQGENVCERCWRMNHGYEIIYQQFGFDFRRSSCARFTLNIDLDIHP